MNPIEIIEVWEEKGVDEILKEIYRSEVEDLLSHVEEKEAYIGSVFSIFPSGKFWTPWACSNMTPKEMAKDQLFSEALDEVAEKYGGYITHGEGDPTDLFFVRNEPDEE